jgi:AraC family transcriptional regulator, L-rhamnose operon regulatory protein RhaS
LRNHPEHLTEPWSVVAMAESCGLGLTQLVHHVKSLTNMTPARFLVRLRLSEAARLLRECPAASITDIALNIGFSSSQHFATVFADRFGCTPREFRAQAGSAADRVVRGVMDEWRNPLRGTSCSDR